MFARFKRILLQKILIMTKFEFKLIARILADTRIELNISKYLDDSMREAGLKAVEDMAFKMAYRFSLNDNSFDIQRFLEVSSGDIPWE